MMNFLFNEQSAIENAIQMKLVDNDNVFSTIMDLARYNYFVKEMDSDDSYQFILKYLMKNGKDINEENIYSMIDDCIIRAKKYPFKTIDKICITKSELSFIGSLNDIKKEKIAFVLLATAKYYDMIYDTQNGYTYMRNSDICKFARVTIPSEDRNVFMQFACDSGVLQRHSFAGSITKKVAFVSYDENDEIVLELHETDYMDLAYTYLHYKNPRQYRKCRICKKWIKVSKKYESVCKECSEKGALEKPLVQMKTCIDCGNMFSANIKDTQSCRCEDCQHKKQLEYQRISMAKLRENVK